MRAFELEGAEVQWPFLVRLFEEEACEQIDGAIFWNGMACLIEAKDRRDPVNADPIHKLRNQLLRRPGGAFGVVFSRSGFTEAAKTVAHFTAPQSVLLWDGLDLTVSLESELMCRGLQKKWRWLVERGIPDYELRRDMEPQS